MSSEDKRQEWLRTLGLMNPGAWCLFPYAFTVLGSDEAILLAALIDQLSCEIRAEKDEDLWMRMPTKRIMGRLRGWHSWKIKRALSSLRHVISVESRGVPKKSRQRWIKIDPERLRKALKQEGTELYHHEGGGYRTVPKGGGETVPIRTKQEDGQSYATASPRETFRVKSLRYAPYREFAQRLHDAVQSVRKVNCTSKPSTWAQSFRTLHRRGATIERIEEVLKWYESTLKRYGDLMRAGTTFIPIAYTGPKWLDKWEALEGAMERERSSTSEEGPKLRPKLRIVKVVKSRHDEWGFET